MVDALGSEFRSHVVTDARTSSEYDKSTPHDRDVVRVQSVLLQAVMIASM